MLFFAVVGAAIFKPGIVLPEQQPLSLQFQICHRTSSQTMLENTQTGHLGLAFILYTKSPFHSDWSHASRLPFSLHIRSSQISAIRQLVLILSGTLEF